MLNAQCTTRKMVQKYVPDRNFTICDPKNRKFLFNDKGRYQNRDLETPKFSQVKLKFP